MIPAGNGWLPFLMFTMLIFGASNVLLKEYMVNTEVPVLFNGPAHNFNHPLLWSLLMKAGMALCLPFHLQYPQAPLRVFAISCFLGFVADVLVNMAYCAIAGSAIQMLRGGKVFFTALLSVVVLKRRLHPHQIFGAGAVIVGLSLVGASTQMHPMERHDMNFAPSMQVDVNWMALGWCFLSEIIQSALWIYQECVLREYGIPPLQLVGLEGIIGVGFGSWVAIVAHNLKIEDITLPLCQLMQSTSLLWSVFFLLISMALFNFAGVGVTKYGSAITRSVVDASRAILIWAVELWYGWHVFSFSQLIGFIVLMVGAGVYNGFIHLPCCPPDDECIAISQHEAGKRSSV
jgi:drug/metabolite transporter (DMT)-like permease